MWVKKLITAARGHVNNAGEELVDQNAITILEQEIRDSESEIKKAEQSLATIKSKRSMAEEDAKNLEAEIEKYKGHGKKALAADDQDLARDIKHKLDGLKSQHATKSAMAAEFLEHEKSIESNTKTAKQRIDTLKLEIESIKATESAQKAHESVTKNFAGNRASLSNAQDSLSRIKERQRAKQHQLKAAGDIADGGDDLESRLAALDNTTDTGDLSSAFD